MNLTVRNLAFEDADLILGWRNSLEVRKVSRNSSQITAREHYSWVKSWLEPENRGYFWIYSESNNDIGYVRFDALDDPILFEISILIDGRMRGRGLGKMILEDSINRFAIKNEGKLLRAVVHASNLPSLRLFSLSGFDEVRCSDQWFEFVLNLQEFR